MPRNEIPFDDLAAYLLARADELLPRWLPGGHMEGKEYCCADISGGAGRTMKVNTVTGVWSDFAVQALAGGDLISLYAAKQGIKQGEAAKILMEDTGYSSIHPSTSQALVQFPTKAKPVVATPTTGTKPPKDAPIPIFGNAADITAYKDFDGSVICYIARYEPVGKPKVPIPFTWDGKGWVKKAYPGPRPLLNLDRLASFPMTPALIVEGEVKAKKLQEIVGDRYVVTTWMGGAKAEHKTDFKVLRGREVLLWPDADSDKRYPENHPTMGGQRLPYEEQPGPSVMIRIAEKLAAICPDVKLLDLRDLYSLYGQEGGVKDGWDAADAAAEGWTWERFFTWAKPRAIVVPAPAQAAAQKFPVVEMTQNSGPAPVGVDGLWLRAGVIRLSSGQALCNVDNVLRLMKVADEFGNEKEPAIWWDEFHQKIFTNWNRNGKGASEWSEVDTLNLLVRFQGDYGFRRLGDDILFKTVTTFAHRNPRSEPKEWMEKLVWDKKERIIKFWTTYFGVADGWYAIQMGLNFWLSMVSRVYLPGCQSDHMVIMEGPEGVGKSSALGVIGGKWYTAMMLDLGKIQAFLEVLPGKMIVEISELDAFRRADANTIKKITSNREDRYRAAYGRMAVDFKRQCIFVGTTNEREYLAGTGSTDRRFWPVRVETVRMEELRRDREQLFAEAVHYYKAGRKWWEMPEEVEAERDRRREVDPWEDLMQEQLHTMNEITTSNVGSTILNIAASKQDWQFARRVGKLMHKLGYELVNRRDDVSKQNVRRWVKVAQSDLLGE